MSKLIIEDCPRRIDAFRKAFGRNIMVANCRANAMAHLFLGPEFTTIYLDYDGVDGGRIAQTMVDNNLQRHAKVKIHSSNIMGSIEMYDTLEAAGYDVELVEFEDVVG